MMMHGLAKFKFTIYILQSIFSDGKMKKVFYGGRVLAKQLFSDI